MIELAYTHESENQEPIVYTLVQYEPGPAFEFMPNGGLVNKAEKKNGKWLQTDGEQEDPDLVETLGKFIEAHHNNHE